ncbi:MAG: (Fe-S)-binding protein [Coriobacteriia bacterium]|nr:(Fe-S)-binding protein [Coriobacteriia bacterium]
MSRENAVARLSDAAANCLRCGTCTRTCDILGDAGLSMSAVAGGILSPDADQTVVDTVLRCALCGLCCVDCPVDVDAHQVMTAARESLALDSVLSTEGFETVAVDHDFNLFSVYRDDYGISFHDLTRESCEAVFFPGCIMATYAPELTRRTCEWLAEQGVRVSISDLCCGSPLISLGLADRAEKLREHMAELFSATGATKVITACPGCQAELDGRLGGIEVVPLSAVMRQLGARIADFGRVTVHDSCRDRCGLFGDDVRAILSDCELVEMEHHHANTMCCGSGGMVSAVDPDLYEARGRTRIDEFRSTGADHLVIPCVTCGYLLSKHSEPGEVLHYLEAFFGTRIEWAGVRASLEALFAGEQGESVFERLSQAQCFTGWAASGCSTADQLCEGSVA